MGLLGTEEVTDLGFTIIATLLPFEDSAHLKDPDIKVVRCDVTSEEQTLELKAQTQALTNGKLDVLVNNAGICISPSFEKLLLSNPSNRLYNDRCRH